MSVVPDFTLLERYIRARNVRRASEVAAQDYTFGLRVRTLKTNRRLEREALLALADWVEAKARIELDYLPPPV